MEGIPLRCHYKNDRIVIEIGHDTLAHATSINPDFYNDLIDLNGLRGGEMNAQTRREIMKKVCKQLGFIKIEADYTEHDPFAMCCIDNALREWGLEMAKIAKRAHDPTASDAVFTEVCVAVADDITAANDQQKGA